MFQAPPPEVKNAKIYAGFLDWKAQGSHAHNIPPASWMIRQDGVIRPYPEMSNGLVWDIENIETGWQIWPNGGNKQQVPNPAVHQPLPSPGEGYQKYLKIPMAQDPNTCIIWDQASQGSFAGFCEIAAQIQQQSQSNAGKLPVIRFVGSTLTSMGQNGTQVPNFEIIQWVERPQCLLEQPAESSFSTPQQPPVQSFEKPQQTDSFTQPQQPSHPKGVWS